MLSGTVAGEWFMIAKPSSTLCHVPYLYALHSRKFAISNNEIFITPTDDTWRPLLCLATVNETVIYLGLRFSSATITDCRTRYQTLRHVGEWARIPNARPRVVDIIKIRRIKVVKIDFDHLFTSQHASLMHCLRCTITARIIMANSRRLSTELERPAWPGIPLSFFQLHGVRTSGGLFWGVWKVLIFGGSYAKPSDFRRHFRPTRSDEDV